MKSANLIVFDIETGGLTADKNPITEIAAIALNIEDLTEIGRYEAIISPYKNVDGSDFIYDQKALDVTGMTMNQINNGKDSKTVIKEFIEFANSIKVSSLKYGQGLPVLCGHNIDKFDIPFMVYFFDLHKKDISKTFNQFTLDTILLSKLKWGNDDSVNFKLGTCCENVGIELIEAHRAMNDVEGNVELLKIYINLLRNNLEYSSNLETKNKFRKEFKIG